MTEAITALRRTKGSKNNSNGNLKADTGNVVRTTTTTSTTTSQYITTNTVNTTEQAFTFKGSVQTTTLFTTGYQPASWSQASGARGYAEVYKAATTTTGNATVTVDGSPDLYAQNSGALRLTGGFGGGTSTITATDFSVANPGTFSGTFHISRWNVPVDLSGYVELIGQKTTTTTTTNTNTFTNTHTHSTSLL